VTFVGLAGAATAPSPRQRLTQGCWSSIWLISVTTSPSGLGPA
jgi:hypothetical protein